MIVSFREGRKCVVRQAKRMAGFCWAFKMLLVEAGTWYHPPRSSGKSPFCHWGGWSQSEENSGPARPSDFVMLSFLQQKPSKSKLWAQKWVASSCFSCWPCEAENQSGLLLQLSGFASKQMCFGHLSEGGEKMSSCFGMLQLPLSKSIFIVHSHMCRNYPQHVRCAIYLYSLSHLPSHGTQAPPILNFKALQCIHWRPSKGKKREYRSHYKHSAQKRNDKRNSVIPRSPNLGALCCLDPKAWENYNILKSHLEWWLCFCQSSWMTLGHSASA